MLHEHDHIRKVLLSYNEDSHKASLVSDARWTKLSDIIGTKPFLEAEVDGANLWAVISQIADQLAVCATIKDIAKQRSDFIHLEDTIQKTNAKYTLEISLNPIVKSRIELKY